MLKSLTESIITSVDVFFKAIHNDVFKLHNHGIAIIIKITARSPPI